MKASLFALVGAYSPDDPPITAAAVSGHHVAIVTAFVGINEIWRDSDRSGLLELKIDDQEHIQEFASLLDTFLRSLKIDRIYLCNGVATGPYCGRPIKTKLETVIRLTAAEKVVLIASASISAWANRAQPLLSSPPRELSAVLRKLDQKAQKTAGYAVAKNLHLP